MNIITELDQLRTPAEPLTFLSDAGADTVEGDRIVQQLKETMQANAEILALSAPQIGINKRIFCIRFNDQIKTFINPIITKKKDISIVIETCASMPGKEVVIGRPKEITVVYYNDEFNYEDNKLIGAAAGLFDQQAQLLDGVTPADLGLVSDIEADGKIEDTDLEDIIKFYKDTFLPTKLNALNTAIEEDDEATKALKQLSFTEGVINGRIAVVEPEEDAKRRAKAKSAAQRTITNSGLADKIAQKAHFKNYAQTISKKSHKKLRW